MKNSGLKLASVVLLAAAVYPTLATAQAAADTKFYSGKANAVSGWITLLDGTLVAPIGVQVAHVVARQSIQPSSQVTQTVALNPGSTSQLLILGGVGEAAVKTGNTTIYGGSNAFASIEELSIGLGPVTPDALVISADALEAFAGTTCLPSRQAITGGGSFIANLTIAGIPIVVDGLPNQTVTIPGVATVIINEQTSTITPGSGSVLATGRLEVTALHIDLLPPLSMLLRANLYIGNAVAQITCKRV